MTKRTDRQVRRGERIIDRLRSQMYAESDADLGIALSASGAGQANLMAQTRAGTRSLLASQRGNSAAINSLTSRARAQRGVVAGQEAGARNRYGSALGSSIAQSFAPAAARAAGTGSVLRGYKGASATARRTAGDVAGIAAAGVKAQGAAAKYMMAQALQQRNIIDNQTLAALTGDLYKQAISYNQQWSLWKRQQDYAAKQAEKAGGGAARSTVEALMDEGGAIASNAADAWREVRGTEDVATFDITAAATTWATQNGYGEDSPQASLYAATLRNIKNGMNADDAYAAAVKTLFASTPGFDKWGDAVVEAGMSNVSLSTDAAYNAAMELKASDSQASGNGSSADDYLFSLIDIGYGRDEAIAKLLQVGIIDQSTAERLRNQYAEYVGDRAQAREGDRSRTGFKAGLGESSAIPDFS